MSGLSLSAPRRHEKGDQSLSGHRRGRDGARSLQRRFSYLLQSCPDPGEDGGLGGQRLRAVDEAAREVALQMALVNTR